MINIYKTNKKKTYGNSAELYKRANWNFIAHLGRWLKIDGYLIVVDIIIPKYWCESSE